MTQGTASFRWWKPSLGPGMSRHRGHYVRFYDNDEKHEFEAVIGDGIREWGIVWNEEFAEKIAEAFEKAWMYDDLSR